MKKTQVVLIDDIDGSVGESTIPFSFKGVNYEIDLSAENLAKFESELAEWIGAARRVGGRAIGTRGRKSAGTGGRTAQIREWARGQGLKVSDRGRIPAEIVEAFEKANA
ncbi:Lsr2 family protein [Schaalia sp. 19OD2882]|uniref:histone-like nucleoid-structuring protein Lsr2 n=1 Tax=Schaalia sp. 19OD2882 TaxID=2794089 RepID=UPI001C1EE660|nr:Lsr2 family protein [Schaalia sp. 19OD2882]QWW19784.1 Lsr2 family protein [Schaalia sp. 19OD2882]